MRDRDDSSPGPTTTASVVPTTSRPRFTARRHATVTRAIRLVIGGGVAAILLAAASPVRAQPVATPSPPLLRQVIPKPTGQNGYEELLAAADALRVSERYRAIEPVAFGFGASGATLDKKRRALRDPPVIRALELLRRGLSKPVLSPRETLSIDTTFPEYGAFRGLARLLSLQQYVHFADGRVPEAIESARLGLRFSTAIQTDTLISGLVGIACSSIAIRGLGRHLDQLSARDCDLLHQVCLDWLRQPDPYPRIMDAERKAGLQLLADFRDGKVDPASVLYPGAEDGEAESEEEAGPRRAVAEVKRLKASSPERYVAAFMHAQSLLDRHYSDLLAEWQKPVWQRASVALPRSEGPADRLMLTLIPAAPQVNDKYTLIQSMVRLLACHAAIRRHRWEHDRLPASLAELNLGELAIDPFTGQVLKYQVRGTKYLLTSAGPSTTEDDPKAVDGRLPISVVPGE